MALMPQFGRRSPRPVDELFGPRLWRSGENSFHGSRSIDQLLDDFTRRWERGERPRAEDYIGLLSGDDEDGPVELVYREYCLAESSGLAPDPSSYLLRFPTLGDRLIKVLGVDRDLSKLLGWRSSNEPSLPVVGDEVGPYRLITELGRGSFARVFLAEQTDLENRPLVVKISARPTAEARLMARADHPNIVPILRDALTEEGLHVVCMPYLGGATLSSVLDGIRSSGRRPVSGSTILEELNRVAVARQTGMVGSSASRDLISGLRYSRAVAWMIARLADALDRAFERQVTHGDLKPSNVLIAADGQPMLLDFNLSTDWSSESDRGVSDVGGTLAYMAPERLRALADQIGEAAKEVRPIDRHRADIYSLGLVLLEALTLSRPLVPPAASPGEDLCELANRLASVRGEWPVPVRTGWGKRRGPIGPLSRSAWPASVPAGLRPVLSRCLDPNPSRRYRTARQLAEDLDRWRDELPLRHARPAAWTEMIRRVQRRRLVLLAAGLLLSGGVGLGSAIVRSEMREKELAANFLSELWDRIDPATYQFRTPGHEESYASIKIDQSAAAWGYVDRLGIEDGPDWMSERGLDCLPEAGKSDLKAWGTEQALRLGLRISQPEFEGLKAERSKVLTVFTNLSPDLGSTAAKPLYVELGGKAPVTTSAPEDWYIAFVNALMADLPTPEEAERLSLDPAMTTPQSALTSFVQASAWNPGSFWTQYKTAVAASRLEQHAIAERSLRKAIEIRPENAPAWLGLSSCLYYQKRFDEAIQACDRARELDGTAEEVCKNLVFLARDDLSREAALAQLKLVSLTRGGSAMVRMKDELNRLAARGAVGMAIMGLFGGNNSPQHFTDLDVRYQTACNLMREEVWFAAYEELGKVLAENPDHLAARFDRAVAAQHIDRTDEANTIYMELIDHPDFEELLSVKPGAAAVYAIVSAHLLRQGDTRKGHEVATRGLAQAMEHSYQLGGAHYALARVYAVLAQADPSKLTLVAEHLLAAGKRSRQYLGNRLDRDEFFKPILVPLRAKLKEMQEASAK